MTGYDLSPKQLDGIKCVECGESSGRMFVVPDVYVDHGDGSASQLFACVVRCYTKVDVGRLLEHPRVHAMGGDAA